MTGNPATGAGGSWLEPRDTFLLLALSGPTPAEVRRDLPQILAATALFARRWQPAVLPEAPEPAAPLPAAPLPTGPAPAPAASVLAGIPAPLAEVPAPRAPVEAGSWFQRRPSRLRAGFRAGSAA